MAKNKDLANPVETLEAPKIEEGTVPTPQPKEHELHPLWPHFVTHAKKENIGLGHESDWGDWWKAFLAGAEAQQQVSQRLMEEVQGRPQSNASTGDRKVAEGKAPPKGEAARTAFQEANAKRKK